MLEINWIRSNYATSISPEDKSSVDPIGNLPLWKQSNFEVRGLYACVDGTRWRACEATFRFGRDKVLTCANVHLPEDKPDVIEGDKSIRQLARRRELSSILGHLQRTETRLKRAEPRTVINHLIVGDFNCSSSEIEDGPFNTYFKDVWSDTPGSSETATAGYTFDPINNQRAVESSSGQRRIDRMYLNTDAELKPVQVNVICGHSENSAMPPSDHYALCVEFLLGESNPMALYNPLRNNAWAANTPSSKGSMVAIVLDCKEMEQIKQAYDLNSSLLFPHIRLLHGFIEFHGESLDLAIEALRDSIRNVLQEQPSSFTVTFSEESLDVFEHQSSSTLVARPNIKYYGNEWLMQLYDSLGNRFNLCNDQEMHSPEGFIPHASLGKFGSTTFARKAAAEQMGTFSGLDVAVRSIDLLERAPNGKFRTISTMPLSSMPSNRPKGLGHFISDAGHKASYFFNEKAQIVISIINQASRSASRCFDDLHISSEVVPYGSVALDSALPKMSDLDVVVMLRTDYELVSVSQFLALVDKDCYLQMMMACLGETHAMTKMRLRPIHSGLNVLSIQIQPNLPPVDIILCLVGPDGKPANAESVGAFGSIQDNESILTVLKDVAAHEEATSAFSVKDVFCASLRLIKLWAFKRQIYGAKFGFSGGGVAFIVKKNHV
mmetsp:Transcript_3262/g.6140  ORF Transcript_3262/g.6140 Transcript_3262/m.6140 type:complete len:663 (+) Transcript_3262:846-2834(+)